MKNGISRRSFLAGTGAAIGGFAAGSVVGFNTQASAATIGAYTWPAAGLTSATVKANAFSGYMSSGCCYGAAKGLINSIISTLGAGTEWDDIPLDMFTWGGGGAMSWGTLCGALNGSLFVIEQVLGSNATNKNKAIDNLMSWYGAQAFPNTADGEMQTILTGAYENYAVKDPITGATVNYNLKTMSLSTSVCNSPLCHASVSSFCDANVVQIPIGGDATTITKITTANSAGKQVMVAGIEKKLRCATLTAQTAAYTAALIQSMLTAPAGVTGYVYGAANDDCLDCHWKNGTEPSRYIGTRKDNEQGKMDCNNCHEEGSLDDAAYKAADKNKAPKCDRTTNGPTYL